MLDSTPRAQTRADETTFVTAALLYLQAKLSEQKTTGVAARVPKASICRIMCRRGYAPASVDRKRRPMKGFEHLYDPDFPKPIDENASYLEWWLDDLLAYKERKYGRKAA